MIRILRATTWVVLLAGALAVGGALAIARWVLPAMVSAQVRDAIAQHFDGGVSIGRVELSYNGPIRLHDVALRDAAGRQWLRAGVVELTMARWPGPRPVVTSVSSSEVEAWVYFADGRLQWPLRTPQPENAPQPTELPGELDLQRVNIDRLSVALVDERGSAQATELRLDVVRRRGGSWHFWADRAPGAPAGDALRQFSMSGAVSGRQLDVDVQVAMQTRLDMDESAVVLRALRAPLLRAAQGELAGSVNLTGQLTHPESLQFNGAATLAGYTVMGPHGYLIQRGSARAILTARTVQLTDIAGEVAGGQLAGQAALTVARDGQIAYTAHMETSGVELPQLAAVALGPQQQSTAGVLQAQVDVRGTGRQFSGRALLELRNADLQTAPLVPNIFEALGSPRQNVHYTDAAAALRFEGTRITLQKAHLSNQVSAMEVQPGGWVDVGSHQVDMYVIGVPLRAVRQTLKLPVIGIFTEPFSNFTDKLVRLRIKGDWNEPAGRLITKEPLGDVGKGSVDFFGDVVKSGGKLTVGSVQVVGSAFRALGL
jgi:hypothetical protein